MKKTFLYLFIFAVCGVILTSCLGDSTNRQTHSGAFAIVRTGENAEKQAWTAGNVAITWGDLSKYQTGDALILSYEFDLNDITANGSFPAEGVVVSAEYPLATQKTVQVQPVDLTEENNPNRFESISLTAYSGNEYFLDRWLFFIKAKAVGDQSINAEFFYDKDSQFYDNDRELPAKTIVVDVKLVKGPEEAGTATSKEKYLIANFSSIRNLPGVKPAAADITTAGTEVKVWLRYFNESGVNYVQNVGGLVYYKED